MSETFITLAHTPNEGVHNEAEWTVGDKYYVNYWAKVYAKDYKHVFIRSVGPIIEEVCNDTTGSYVDLTVNDN